MVADVLCPLGKLNPLTSINWWIFGRCLSNIFFIKDIIIPHVDIVSTKNNASLLYFKKYKITVITTTSTVLCHVSAISVIDL